MNNNFLHGTLFPLPEKKLNEAKDNNGNYKTRPINIYHKRNYDTLVQNGVIHGLIYHLNMRNTWWRPGN